MGLVYRNIAVCTCLILGELQPQHEDLFDRRFCSNVAPRCSCCASVGAKINELRIQISALPTRWCNIVRNFIRILSITFRRTLLVLLCRTWCIRRDRICASFTFVAFGTSTHQLTNLRVVVLLSSPQFTSCARSATRMYAWWAVDTVPLTIRTFLLSYCRYELRP